MKQIFTLFFFLLFSFIATAQLNFQTRVTKVSNLPLVTNNSGTSLSSQFVTGNFNGDSFADVVCINLNDSSVVTMLGNGDGLFTFGSQFKHQQLFVPSSYPYNCLMISDDFNKDGKLDIAIAITISNSKDSLYIFNGNGNGQFTNGSKYEVSIPASNSKQISAIKSGKFNNDSNPDIVLLVYDSNIPSSNKLLLLIGDGLGSFSAPISISNLNQSTKLATTDFNGDGKQDLVTQFSPNQIKVLLADSINGFASDTILPSTFGYAYSIICNDFNMDGFMDIATVSYTDKFMDLYFGDGLGHFPNNQGNQLQCTNNGIYSFTSGDFNNDAIPDLFYLSSNTLNSTNASFALGDGTGVFDTVASCFEYICYSGNSSSLNISIVDLNNDGLKDVVKIGETPSLGGHGIHAFLNSSIIQQTDVYFNPAFSGTCGYSTITFFGQLINPKMHLKFTATGQPDIDVPDSNITYKGTHTFKANVDFSTATIGKYNVVLTDSNGITTTITDGFEVQATSPPNLEIKIVGPSQTRIGLPTRYYLKVTNNGNCNALAVPIMLFVSGKNKVTFVDSIYDFDGNKRDTMLYAELDNYFGNEGKSKGYMFLINQVPSNGTIYYPIEITALSPHEQCQINVSVGIPFVENGINHKKNRDLDAIISNPAFGCAQSVVEAVAGQVAKDALNCSWGGHKLFAQAFLGAEKGVDLGFGIGSTLTACASTGVSILLPEYKALQLGLKIFGAASDGGAVGVKCACLLDNFCLKDEKDFEGRSAHDPNDKTGIGVGNAHWINNTETLSYGIHFENVDTASASAQVVILRDTLDITKVDITTFKPELITISNHPIDFSTYKANQPLLYDMRPAINLIVKIEIKLDSLSGEVKVVYTSLDPATMQLTTDPLLGFLPPNINKPDGEGSFYYSVKLKAGLPNNTDINNTANIYFDANDPILTPTWANTIDILPPTSKMNSIIPNTNDTTIYLSWSGADAQSGVQKYDVMYSENGGAFQSYVSNFPNDSLLFNGKAGASYSFYTIAIDNVGNREVKSNGEVSTKINEQDVQIFPNPSNGEFTVQVKNDLEVSKLGLFDMQGNKVPITYKKNNNTYLVQVPAQQNVGTYVLKIVTADKSFTGKILIQK